MDGDLLLESKANFSFQFVELCVVEYGEIGRWSLAEIRSNFSFQFVARYYTYLYGTVWWIWQVLVGSQQHSHFSLQNVGGVWSLRVNFWPFVCLFVCLCVCVCVCLFVCLECPGPPRLRSSHRFAAQHGEIRSRRQEEHAIGKERSVYRKHHVKRDCRKSRHGRSQFWVG